MGTCATDEFCGSFVCRPVRSVATHSYNGQQSSRRPQKGWDWPHFPGPLSNFQHPPPSGSDMIACVGQSEFLSARIRVTEPLPVREPPPTAAMSPALLADAFSSLPFRHQKGLGASRTRLHTCDPLAWGDLQTCLASHAEDCSHGRFHIEGGGGVSSNQRPLREQRPCQHNTMCCFCNFWNP